jgi:hypothetical protein
MFQPDTGIVSDPVSGLLRVKALVVKVGAGVAEEDRRETTESPAPRHAQRQAMTLQQEGRLGGGELLFYPVTTSRFRQFDSRYRLAMFPPLPQFRFRQRKSIPNEGLQILILQDDLKAAKGFGNATSGDLAILPVRLRGLLS